MIKIDATSDRKALAIYFLLGAIVLIFWLVPVPKLSTKPIRSESPPVIASLPPNGSAPDMSQLVARPLFVQSRRPKPIAQAPITSTPARPAAPSTSGMVLLGILHAGSKAVALVTLPDDARPKEIVVGAVLGDWIVIKISTDRLILRSGGTIYELFLPKPAAASTGFSPAPMRRLPAYPDAQ